jgi:hypothetical protein
LLGIAFLGTISAPIQAANNPPSTWDKLFGSDTKQPELEQKKSKPKKAKQDKPTQRPKQSKTGTTPSAQSSSTEEPIREIESRPTEKAVEKPLTTPEQDSSTSIGGFFKGVFGGASSTSPLLEGGNQAETPKAAPGAPTASPVAPVAPVVAPVNSQKTVSPPEPSNSEPFWKRIFGGASSQPLDTRIEPSAKPTPATPATSRSTTDEEAAFTQKLSGGKPSSETNSKGESSATKSSDKTNEPSSTSNPINNVSDNQSINLPAALTANPNASETKTNFSLSNVCEREKCELMILYDAPINKANVEKFIQSTASIPAGTAVLFNSIDGDLNSGIKLGQVLRQKRFNARIGRTKLNKKTLVESDGQCFSACTLAFAGGVSRRIDPNDQIGIYALRSNSKTINENEMRTAINGLSIYLEQMGVDRRLVDQMLQVKGSAVSIISLSNAKLLNLDNSSRTTTYPWRMQALDDGLLIALVSEKQASGNFSVTLGLTKQNRELRLTIYIKPTSESLNLSQLSDFLNRNARLQMSFANQTISPSLIKPWEATGSGIQTAVLLSDKELTSLSSALEFEVELAQINRNPYNLDGVSIFGTQGLKGALSTIKK